MRSTTVQNLLESPPDVAIEGSCPQICLKCGGNGYTKTSPDCYKTCLDCLGKGLALN